MGKPAVSVRILTCTAVTARSRLTRDRSIAAVESKLRQIGLTRPHKQEALRENHLLHPGFTDVSTLLADATVQL